MDFQTLFPNSSYSEEVPDKGGVLKKYTELVMKHVFKKYDVNHAILRRLNIEEYEYLFQMDDIIGNACCKGHLSVVKYLVKKGTSINYCSAAQTASENGHLSVVKYLVGMGADLTADNNYTIRAASRNGHLDMVKYLVENGADKNAAMACLPYGPPIGQTEMIRYLAGKGVDLVVKNGDSCADTHKPIIMAIRYNDLDLLKYLIGLGAEIPDIKSCVGETIERGQNDMAKYLLEKYSSVELNKHASSVAGKYYNIDLLEYLLKNVLP